MFFFWEYGQEQSFIDNINKMHSTIKFMTVRSKTSLHFSDVTESITEGIIESDLYVKPTDSYNIFCRLPGILFIAKRVYHLDRH